MRRKQNLANALGIQEKIEGNHAFFRDNEALIWKKKRHTLLCRDFTVLRIIIA